jgi:hypothetical protein
MIYQSGDYVYPADLPRAVLCRVSKAENVHVRTGMSQILRLEPLEGPWPAGTTLVRLDEYVVPAKPRQLWQGSLIRPSLTPQKRPTRAVRSEMDAA